MEKVAQQSEEPVEGSKGVKAVKVLSGSAALEEARLKEPPVPFSYRSCLLYLACLVGFFASTSNGYDGALLNSLLMSDRFLGFFHIENKGIWTGIINNMYTIGSVVALPFVGPIVDRLGRRSGMFIGSVLIIVGTVIQAMTVKSPEDVKGQFMGGRFVLGFGVAISTAAAPIYVLEVSHPCYRGVVTAWYNTFWFTGSILAAGAARGSKDLSGNRSWLTITWLQCLFAGIIVVVVWFLPESPRWLYVHGKQERCKKFLTYWHGMDNPESVWVRFQLQEYEEYLEMDGSDKRWWDYRALFRNKASAYRLCCNLIVAVFGQWAGNCVLSYFLGAVLDTCGYTSKTQQLNINLILSCVQFLTALIGARFVDLLGRRFLLLFANIGCCITWIGMTIATHQNQKTHSTSSGRAALSMIFLFDIIFAFGFTPLQALYPVEVLSFEQRAKGMAFSSFIMNAAMMMNNFAWPESMKKIGWKTYIIFTIWDAFQAIVIYFVIPETRNRTLEELDEIFKHRNPRKASTQKTRVGITEERHVVEIEKGA